MVEGLKQLEGNISFQFDNHSLSLKKRAIQLVAALRDNHSKNYDRCFINEFNDTFTFFMTIANLPSCDFISDYPEVLFLKIEHLMSCLKDEETSLQCLSYTLGMKFTDDEPKVLSKILQQLNRHVTYRQLRLILCHRSLS